MNQERREVVVEDIASRLSEAHLHPYYHWLRQLLGLSSGALTLLVALQGNYIPEHPQGLLLLQLCWGLLAASILSALLALYGESAIPLAEANRLRKMARERGEMSTASYLRKQKFSPSVHIYEYARIATILAFALAVVLMSSFAMINLHPLPRKELPYRDRNIE